MNLAWIAAVLQPHDVAIHPNFRDESYSQDPVGQLAALIIGGDWGRALHDDFRSDEAVAYAGRSFFFETIAEGAEGLIRQAFSRRQKDVARSTALVLLASCALAEMEEYDKCDSILTEMLMQTSKSSPGLLARAALLQQRALRRRDAGDAYVGDIFDAARILESLEAADLPEFRLGPGVSGSSVDTMRRTIYALKRSVWSLTPHELDDELPFSSFPSHFERLKRPLSDRLLRIAADRASDYSQYMHRSFSRHYGRSQTVTIGQSPIDLFHEALAVELLGHAEVYRARRDLALLRLVQHAEGVETINIQDALRLLRHAGAAKELELTLEHFRSAGPLSVLSRDARQILLRRSSPTKLRVPELLVLKAAAEMMAPSEAEPALRVVLDSIAAGGPPDVVGSWQHPGLRLGAAWQTAAVLSWVCQKGGEVGALLLSEVRAKRSYDELHDQSFAKALELLPWSQIPGALKAEWESWMTSDSSQGLPDTLEAVSNGIGLPVVGRDPLSGLNEIAMRLNASLGEGATRLRVDEVTEAAHSVKVALDATRESAARGSFSMGRRSASDVGALLISEYDVARSLWDPLAQFLTSNQISRLDRSPAFERLAKEAPDMPDRIRGVFQASVTDLLESRDESLLWGDSTVPYPAALRFFIAYDLVDDARIIAALAELGGSRDLEAKREAARTIASLASYRSDGWLLPFALQMSHDSDVSIKANAARFLVRMAATPGELYEVAAKRLVDLLGNEDGLLVPLFVMRELKGLSELPRSVTDVIDQLAQEHPSGQVRRAASNLYELP
ncbi:hypothetical protein [Streptomyces zinciresistens]|uniref:hypothetical protein n=1 Tax=Streptomyces zinciresistens TaxID=1073330 RepID=UPI0002D6D977|nr:hypothetical protein [Streptomyces zinciresistens]